jgi:hypothetical protein
MGLHISTASNLSTQPARVRRRYPPYAWHCLRGQIDREHRALAVSDPYLPRIKPTLAPVGWGLR